MLNTFSRRLALGIFLLGWQLFTYCSGYAQSLLWKIEGNGLQFPSYLYGTMHVRDKRVFEVSNIVIDKFESCYAFAAELALDSINPAEVMALLKSNTSVSLKSLLSKRDYKRVKKVFKQKLGIELETVDHLQPVHLLTLLQENDLMNPRTGGVEKFLDQQLYDNAKARGMYTTGLEDVKEQLRALSSLSSDTQALMLIEAVKNLDKVEAQSDKHQKILVETYLKGDLEGLLKLFKNEEIPELMKTQLLDVRNLHMTQRIVALIHKYSTFIAVGAAHLPGEKGIIQLLKDKGYRVEPIPFQFDGTGFERLVNSSRHKSGQVSITPASFTVPAQETLDSKEITSNEKEWIVYKSQNGKYSVKFPEKPNETKNEVEGKISYTAMVIKNGGMKSYTASYLRGGGSLEKNISEKIDEALRQFNGKVTKQKDITVQGLKGKEIVIEVMSMIEVTLKIFGNNEITYSLSYSRMLSDTDTQDREIFFNSFQLLK
ncbi:MAG: TraB/GumN family protein [Bacteroidia bacterium]|nr:TraB/GumN family protein [Bacteroidia bacterium]MDW8157630.1 TraB/GumN family protein [Bacteroidia bacterium]